MQEVRAYPEGKDGGGYEFWPESKARNLGYQYDIRFGGYIRKWDVRDTYDPVYFTILGLDDPIYQAGYRMHKMIQFFTNPFCGVMSWHFHKALLK